MKLFRAAIIFLASISAPAAALAESGPQPLGTFGDWTAASYGTGGGLACYAFTTAKTSSPALKKRGAVMLTVTERPAAHDEVTLSAGYPYPKNPTVTLSIGSNNIAFYTSEETAFTASGAAAVAAFQAGSLATAKSSGPHAITITDTFSLTGFSGAYSAITKACP